MEGVGEMKGMHGESKDLGAKNDNIYIFIYI